MHRDGDTKLKRLRTRVNFIVKKTNFVYCSTCLYVEFVLYLCCIKSLHLLLAPSNLSLLLHHEVIIFVSEIGGCAEEGEGEGLASPFVSHAPTPDHKNGNISTTLQRQELLIGASESPCGNASFELWCKSLETLGLLHKRQSICWACHLRTES